MRIDLDEAERLAKAATEGPWRALDGGVRDASDNRIATAHIGGSWDQRDANAAFIVHARTFVPAAVARIRELEAALAKYGAHIGHHETGRGPACSRRDRSECDCGLDAALGRQR